MFLAAGRPRAAHGGSKYTPTPPQHLNSTPPIHFYPLTLSHPPPSTTTHAPAAPPRKMDTSDFFVLVCVCVWFVFSFIYIRFVTFRQFCEFSRARAYIETGGLGCGRMGPISGKHVRRKLRWIAILPVLNKPGRLGHLRCTLSRYKASIIISGAEHRSRLTSRDSARTHMCLSYVSCARSIEIDRAHF